MPTPSDIRTEALREPVQRAFDALRAGDGTEAVKVLAGALLRFVELYPEVRDETIQMRGRAVPKLLRWPALGANMKPESLKTGQPEIEFVRDRFSVSEAMTYYQFLLDEILAKEQAEA